MVEIRKTKEGYPQQNGVFVLLLPYSFILETSLHLHIPPILPKNKGKGRRKDKHPSEKWAQHREKKDEDFANYTKLSLRSRSNQEEFILL